jgi:DNA-binding MarR family transcriptional regulator
VTEAMGAAAPARVERQDVGPDAHLTYLISKVQHQLTLRLDRALQTVGLTLVQFSALANISARPGLSSADLARALLISPQAVGTLIQRMSTAGLVRRGRQPRGYPGVLRLTEEGSRRLIEGERVALRVESENLSSLRPDEQEQVFATLTRLLQDLDKS